MTDIRQILAFMGINIVAATMVTAMFGSIVGTCLSIGFAVGLSQLSIGDFP